MRQGRSVNFLVNITVLHGNTEFRNKTSTHIWTAQLQDEKTASARILQHVIPALFYSWSKLHSHIQKEMLRM